jgi:hypothetical protein
MVPLGERYGLPVEDQSFSRACNRSKAIVGRLVRLIVPAALDPLLNHMDFGIVSEMPGEICRGSRRGYHSWRFFDPHHVCAEWWQAEHLQELCEHELEGGDEFIETVDLVGEIDPIDKSTKRVFKQARNGSDHMQVYSFVRGRASFISGSDKGVEAPTWGAAEVAEPGGTYEDLGVAQAEYYYDQTEEAADADLCWHPCPAGLTWESYEENALWNLRWRARMRRYRIPSNVDVNVLESPVPPLDDMGHDDGLAAFNAGVGLAPTLIDSHVAAETAGGDAAKFIGDGPTIIH